MRVDVCLCVYTRSISEIRTFSGSEDILAATHNFKGLIEGRDLVIRL